MLRISLVGIYLMYIVLFFGGCNGKNNSSFVKSTKKNGKDKDDSFYKFSIVEKIKNQQFKDQQFKDQLKLSIDKLSNRLINLENSIFKIDRAQNNMHLFMNKTHEDLVSLKEKVMNSQESMLGPQEIFAKNIEIIKKIILRDEDTINDIVFFNKFKEKFEKDFTCIICLDTYEKPVTLNQCGHVFCKACIDEALKSRPCCPICNKEYPRWQQNNQTKNYDLERILKYMNEISN